MYDSYRYGGSLYYSFADSGWRLLLGVIGALVCTILLFILVFPKSKEGKLSAFWEFLRGFFDIRYLFIEKIAKFLYVFATLACVFTGFFMLFGRTFFAGLMLMVLGVIACRLLYELLMLAVLLVKNVIEINEKLQKAPGASSELDNPFEAPTPVFGDAAPAAEAERSPTGKRFCSNCGAELESGSHFCSNCGGKVD